MLRIQYTEYSIHKENVTLYAVEGNTGVDRNTSYKLTCATNTGEMVQVLPPVFHGRDAVLVFLMIHLHFYFRCPQLISGIRHFFFRTTPLGYVHCVSNYSHEEVHPFCFGDNFPNCKPIQVIFGRNIVVFFSRRIIIGVINVVDE